MEDRPREPEPEKAPRTTWEFLRFVLHGIVARRKWFLIPLWILLAVLAVLLLFSGSSFLLPAIYIGF
jgi:hypothetical protein